MLLHIGASSNGGGLLSGLLSAEVLETVVGVAGLLNFVDILALNLLVDTTLFLFSVGLLTFLTLGLVSH